MKNRLSGKLFALLAMAVAILFLAAAGAMAETLQIPADTKSIEAEAFAGDMALAEVVLPEGIEEIGERAFAESNVQKINLPSSLSFIADDALDRGKNIQVTAEAGTYAYDWAQRNGFIRNLGPWAYPVPQAEVTGNLVTLTIASEEPAEYYEIAEYVNGNYRTLLYNNTSGIYQIYGETPGTHVYAVRAVIIDENYDTKKGDMIRTEPVVVEDYETVDSGISNISFGQYGKDSLTVRVLLRTGSSGNIKGVRLLQQGSNETIGDIPISGYYGEYRADHMWVGRDYISVVAWTENDAGERLYSSRRFYQYELKESDGDFLYKETADGITITGYRGTGKDGLYIPDTLNGKPVTAIDTSAFCDRRGSDQAPLINGALRIPDTVRVIGHNAFANCTGLTGTLSLPAGLTDLKSSAFEGCTGFTGDLTIPGTVRTIGSSAFKNCTGFDGVLTMQTGTSYVDGSAFANSGFTRAVLPSTMEKLSWYAFSNCPSLETVVAMGSDTVMDYAFGASEKLSTFICKKDSAVWTWAAGKNYEVQELTEEAPEELVYRAIDENTCEVIGYTGSSTNIEIPEKNPEGLTVVRIGDSAFRERGQTFDTTGGQVSIPDTVTSIGAYAFMDADYGTINIPAGLREIGEHAFDGESMWIIDEIRIPEGVTVIPDYAFHDCQNVHGYSIPEGVTEIGSYAFSNCGSSFVKEVTIPSTVTKIRDHAFFYNYALETVHLGENITEIGNYAFSQTALKTCELPDSISVMGDGAFHLCALTEIHIPAALKTIPLEAFSGNEVVELEIPGTVRSIGQSAFSIDTLKKLVIHDGVQSIGTYAFWCNSLEDITIEGSVNTINENAFVNVQTTTIKCPKDSKTWEWAEANGFTPVEIEQ